jgi:hypothetical protein
MSTIKNVLEDGDSMNRADGSQEPQTGNPTAGSQEGEKQTPESPRVLAIPVSESGEQSPLGRSTGRRGNGPRTKTGKSRSSRNSLKDGLFSEVSLLEGESHERYQAQLKALREACQPEGALEELLVEKLMSIVWRQRRALSAERDEIEIGNRPALPTYVESPIPRQDCERTSSALPVLDETPLSEQISVPGKFELCMDFLAELREGIEKDGFNQRRDTKILDRVYGEPDQYFKDKTLHDAYLIWQQTSVVPQEDRQREGYPTPEECRLAALDGIDAEVDRLNKVKQLHAERAQTAAPGAVVPRAVIRILRKNVLDGPALDRFLRVEASLERAFDRTLTQLERVQRTRRGLPVPPPIKVEVSS